MEYKINHHIEKEDYLAFVTNHIVSGFLKPLNMVLFTISLAYLIVTPFLTGEFTFLLIALGIIALIIVGIFFVRRNAVKTYDKDSSSFDMKYEFNEEGFAAVMSEGKRELLWSEFYSAKETDKYLFIYVTPQQGLMLVKSQLSEEALKFLKEQLLNFAVRPRKFNFYNK